MSLLPFLHRVAAGEHLTPEDARQAMSVLLEGEASEPLVAAFLVALKMKGETADELAGFARAMRERVIPVDAGDEVIDTCGTGGDGHGTFNISTLAALVMAGAGARVAKHGNRSISNTGAGSAEVMQALGVRFAMTPDEAARAVREIGLAFLFAPNLHPAMKYAQPVRRELKMRTVFNLLGPLANPARAQVQVIGARWPGWEPGAPLSFTAMTAWTRSAPPLPPTSTMCAEPASPAISGRRSSSASGARGWRI